MKRAFVLSEQGVCNVYFIRDEHPRIQWLIDLGIPNFTCFMLELPIPEDNPAHVQIVFNEGTALLLQQIKVFLQENEFGNDAGVLQSIMDAIHHTDIDYAGADAMYGYEIMFTLSSEFYQLVQNRLVKQKVASRQTESPQFKAWFGNSKVVNDEGQPLRVYHATRKDFDKFLPGGTDPTLSGHAIWLSPYPEHQAAGHNVNPDKLNGVRVIPLYAKIERPLVIDDKESLEWARGVFAKGSQEFPQLLPKQWVDEVTRDGEYDGIIFDGEALGWGPNSNEVIVFNGNQVKSAIGNSGQFDPADHRITAGREEELSKAVWRGPDTSKRVVVQDWEKGMVQKRDKKQLEDAKKIIDRYKQTIYKNTPGPLYVIMYDRNGMPRGVSRVTNRGLTKWAAGWGQYIRGEFWLDEYGHAVECDQGDYNHVSYATEYIEDAKRDDIVSAFRDILPEAEAEYPGEAEEEFAAVQSGEMFSRDSLLWGFVPMEEVERIYDNDYKLFSEDIRTYFMKHFNQTHVIDNNFGVWLLNSKNLSAIIDFIFEQAEQNNTEPEQMEGEVHIEQMGEHKWAAIPVNSLVQMKQPGQVWRYKGMAVASKQAGEKWSAWWIRPDGGVIEVPRNMEHWEIVAEELGYSMDEDPMNPPQEALYDAIYQGWIRAVHDGKSSYFEVAKMSQNALHKIQALLATIGGVRTVTIEEDPTGELSGSVRSAEVPFDDFMTLNNPNKLWRMQRVASVQELPHEIEIKLPLHILTELESTARRFDPAAQFRFVGGCVRDMLLDRKPKDVDVVTNTTAQTLEAMGLENVGKAFPVYLYHDREYGQIEVAVARAEEKTGLGHKGFDTVPTGNFEDDTVRRDLNINAMMVDSQGRLYGPEAALENIRSKTLSNVSEKFAEDPLRVFRVARFAAQFGEDWKVDQGLTNLMRRMQPELATLPADRIREETRRALNGKNPLNFFEVLRNADCLDPWFSEVHSNWDGMVVSVQYGAQHHWGFEQQIVGLASQLDSPDTLINRLGLSEQIRRAAQFVKQNRHLIENARQLTDHETVQLIQKGWRGALGFDQLIACALVGGRIDQGRYLLACAEQMKQADMSGVQNKTEATQRLVQAISKVAAQQTCSANDLIDWVRKHHHTEEDCYEGDLEDRIDNYSIYRLEEVPLSKIDLDEWSHDEEMSDTYATQLAESEPPPPILDADYGIIDGTHRLNALAKAGRVSAKCWVGQTGRFASRKTAMSVMEAVEEAAEQVQQELAARPKPWETPAFKAWFGNSKVVNEDGSPKRVMHGTTHDFDEFKHINPNEDNWYGVGYYFTDDTRDVSENYGTVSGPDLTSRIEHLAEQLMDEGGDWEQEAGIDPDEDTSWGTEAHKALREAAKRKAKEMMAGQSHGHVVPVFLKMENPAIVTQKGGTYMGGDSHFSEEDEDEYVEGEQDTRMYEAWEEVCGQFDAWKPESAWETISQHMMEGGISAMDFENAVRQSDCFLEGGGPGPAIAEFYRLMGYDGIIMDANAAFKNMKMNPGTHHYIVWNPRQIKSAIGNRGTWDPDNPVVTAAADDTDQAVLDAPQTAPGHMPHYRVSPRLPRTPEPKKDQGGGIKPFKGKPREDALADKRLQPGLPTMQTDEKKFQKNIDLMRKYPNFGKLDTKAHKAADQIIQHMTENLVWLFEQWEEHRDRSKLWYVGGNALVHRWAKRFDLDPHQVAGVLAAMSPERPWFGNVTLAERFLVAMQNADKLKWDGRMSIVLDGLNDKQQAARANVEGKSLADVIGTTEEDMWNTTLWIKCWDLAHNPRGCRVLTPEGDFGELWRNEKGRVETANVWKYFDHVIKSIKIIRTKSLEDISSIIGQNHKVRSFYNNLIAPLDEEDVTIDTHAVAAALLRPLGTSDIEVTHNFGGAGTGDSAITGSTGLYGLYAEAYRRAAKQMGVLPREMQSITWEAVRALFKSSLKRSIKEQANAVWLAYTRGEADANATRLKIRDLGKGFDRPSWAGPHTTDIEETGDSSYEGKLSSLIRSRRRPHQVSGSRNRVRYAGGSTAQPPRSSLLKSAALKFQDYIRSSYHGQTDCTIAAYSGNVLVGAMDYTCFGGAVTIQLIRIGNAIFDAMESRKLLSGKLQNSKPMVARIGVEMVKYLQREHPDKELRIEWEAREKVPGIEYDEVDSEHAPLFREQEELEAKKKEMEAEWEDPDWKVTDENSEAYYAVIDRLRDIENELNSYPPPKRTKRLVRTSLLEKRNS